MNERAFTLVELLSDMLPSGLSLSSSPSIRAEGRVEDRAVRKRKDRAFTLIELLVVVAVVALLVSILLPSLNRAKQLARRVVCISNIRNLHLANVVYSVENDGFYVIAAADIMGANRHRWHGVRDTVNSPFDPRLGPLAEYLEAWKKQCPSFRDVFTQSGQAGAGFEAACGGYGYNNQYVGGRNDLYGLGGPRYSAKNSNIKTPAMTVAFTDTAFLQGTAAGDRFIEYSFCEAPFWHFQAGGLPSSSRPNPTIHFRHLNTTVVVWMDGHADYQQMSFSADYQTHSRISADEAAKLGLGWFGPDSNELFDLK